MYTKPFFLGNNVTMSLIFSISYLCQQHKYNKDDKGFIYLGPVIQSIISLTSSLMVKMLTILVSTISKSHVFLLKKCEKLLQMQKLLTFSQQIY